MVNLYLLTDSFSETLVEVRPHLPISFYRPEVGDIYFFLEMPLAKVETVVVTENGWIIGFDRKINTLIGSTIGVGTP